MATASSTKTSSPPIPIRPEADSDNDGINDLLDPQPLLAVRDIVFKVNMSIQTETRRIQPGASIRSRSSSSTVSRHRENSPSVRSASGVYSGTLAGVDGRSRTAFRGLQIHHRPLSSRILQSRRTRSSTAISTSGTAHVTQQLAAVFFDDNAGQGSPAYETWAEQFEVPPGGPSLNPDNDAYTNYEEFAFGGDPHNADSSLVDLARDGEYLVVSWNEARLGDVYYDPQQSTDLTPGLMGFSGTC